MNSHKLGVMARLENSLGEIKEKSLFNNFHLDIDDFLDSLKVLVKAGYVKRKEIPLKGSGQEGKEIFYSLTNKGRKLNARTLENFNKNYFDLLYSPDN